jgi:hypothetical protein
MAIFNHVKTPSAPTQVVVFNVTQISQISQIFIRDNSWSINGNSC